MPWVRVLHGLPNPDERLAALLKDEKPSVAFDRVASDLEEAARRLRAAGRVIEQESRRVLDTGFEIDTTGTAALFKLPDPVVREFPDLFGKDAASLRTREAVQALLNRALHGYGCIEGEKAIPVVAPLGTTALADAFSLIEMHGVMVKAVVMNGRDFADLRKFGNGVEGLELAMHRALLVLGIRGYLWGAQILVSKEMPVGEVYVLGSEEDVVTASETNAWENDHKVEVTWYRQVLTIMR